MNTVHHEEVEIVNRLDALLSAKEIPESEVSACLEEWVAHTKEHFDRENRLMQEYGFPPYPVHRNEHDQALQQLLEVQKNWQKTADADMLSRYVREIWPAWFRQHLSTMDTVTANFLSQFPIEVEL